MAILDINRTKIRYMGIESIDVYCFKPTDDCNSQKLSSELEVLATKDESVLLGPKLVKIDSNGLIYDEALDANKPITSWKRKILEKYKVIEYHFPLDTIGLITTREYLKDTIHQLSIRGYQFKISNGGLNFSEQYNTN